MPTDQPAESVDPRAAIRPKWNTPDERARYIQRRLEKRENTPGVSWNPEDHDDIRWACTALLAALAREARMRDVCEKAEATVDAWREMLQRPSYATDSKSEAMYEELVLAVDAYRAVAIYDERKQATNG